MPERGVEALRAVQRRAVHENAATAVGVLVHAVHAEERALGVDDRTVASPGERARQQHQADGDREPPRPARDDVRDERRHGEERRVQARAGLGAVAPEHDRERERSGQERGRGRGPGAGCPSRPGRPRGRSAHASTIASGYSTTPSNTAGATSAFAAPPSIPPKAIAR